MGYPKHRKEHALLNAEQRLKFHLKKTQLGSQFKWDSVAITSNTGGTNTVVDFPGMTGTKALLFQPNNAAAAVQANFATAIDLSLIDTIYIPIIPRDIGVGRSLSLWF